MQQQTVEAAATRPQDSGTGPGREAITPAQAAYLDAMADSFATATIHATHNSVVITANVVMGKVPRRVVQRWERRRGPGKGWVLVEGPDDFGRKEGAIGLEMVELMQRLPFPFEVANMLPRRATAAAIEAIEAAAHEVAHG